MPGHGATPAWWHARRRARPVAAPTRWNDFRYHILLRMTDAQIAPIVGWGSSLLLLVTISYQVWRQWKAEHSEGVSPWLFVGQAFASTGFTIYSVIKGDWVFTFTNAALGTSALVGLYVCWQHARRGRRQENTRDAAYAASSESGPG
jgi:MtN3 and saliva related transmembrane protein